MIKIERIALAMVFGVLIVGPGALLLAPQSGQKPEEPCETSKGASELEG